MPIQTVSQAITNEFNGNSLFNFRNRWFNGKMEIEQRSGNGSSDGMAESAGTAGCAKFVNNGSSVAYCVDRMSGYGQTSGVWKMVKSTDVPTGKGFINSLACTVTSAATLGSSAIHFLGNYIEGYNVADWHFGNSNAKQYTVSFWVKSSIAGTYALISNSGEGPNNWVCVSHYTISQTNTWEYKTVTIPAPTNGGDTHFSKTNGRGIGVWWSFGAGTSFQTSTIGSWFDNGTGNAMWASTTSTQWVTNAGATFFITGVQVELGTTATPFEHRPYSLELALCQRYFFPIYNGAVQGRQLNWPAVYYDQGTRYVSQPITMPVQMRTTPSVVNANTSQSINIWNWPPAGSLQKANTNFSVWSGGANQNQCVTLLNQCPLGPTGNITASAPNGAFYHMDFQAANTIVALSAELQGSV